MIIVRLMGGLGNQLFQYATGRRVALKNDLTLKLDLSWFKDQPGRPYCLNHFDIIENIATPREIAQLKRGEMGLIPQILTTCMECGKPYYLRTYIREKSLDFDPKILEISESAYLDGYWQSEKYFIDIADNIRREFTVKTPFDPVNRQTADAIMDHESVCIHIRRGDYISNPVANQVLGVIPFEYYLSAMRIMERKIKHPHYFVFSDDPAWTKTAFSKYPSVSIVSNNTSDVDKGFEDLRLMSLCKHQIIANSTFSWWGAWLNQNPKKTVIAPKNWFRSKLMDKSDLVPKEWLTI